MSGPLPSDALHTSRDDRRPMLEPRERWKRALILLAFVLVPQLVLYGPSLIGARILLPLDFLVQPQIYAPIEKGKLIERPVDYVHADLVFELEPERRYTVDALRSGRIPLWNPLNYCGTPYLAANHTGVFYPLRVIDLVFPGPVAIAWIQLAKSLLAALGAYLFARRAMRVAFWPAAVGAAMWPNVGFLLLWAGFTISQVGAHLPWLLWTADETVRKPKSRWPIALALATAVLLVSGHASIAMHVMLATGWYALFRLWDVYGSPAREHATTTEGVSAHDALDAPARKRLALGAFAALLFGVLAGVLLSGPQTLPTLDYMKESWRIQQRQQGRVETPAVGWHALPGVVMPYYDGSTQRESVLLLGNTRLESSPAAYAGMLALCVLAPLGFANRRLLRFQWFWLALGFLGLTPLIGVPGLEKLFELPGLNTLRNNRFTLVTAWSTVAMSMAGLDLLVRGEMRWKRWFWLAVALLAIVVAVAASRVANPPDVLREVAARIQSGGAPADPPLDTIASIERVSSWFQRMALGYGAFALGCIALWFALRSRVARTPLAVALIGVLAIGEVTVQGYGANAQCAPELYYPRAPVLEKLATLPPGRMIGWHSLPACLNQIHALSSPSGYDAADPARMVELLQPMRHATAPPASPYGALQWWYPRLPNGLMDLVGLRYLLIFGEPQPDAVFSEKGWWIRELKTALPRAFFAKRGKVVNDSRERLALLTSDKFNPRQVVYLETQDALPADAAAADGDARITLDEPEHVAIDLDVRASGWLVLADRWTDGWRASVDGVERPVLCADHAFRAVHVDTGAKRVEFRYEPKSWRNGMIAFVASLVLMGAWLLWARRAALP